MDVNLAYQQRKRDQKDEEEAAKAAVHRARELKRMKEEAQRPLHYADPYYTCVSKMKRPLPPKGTWEAHLSTGSFECQNDAAGILLQRALPTPGTDTLSKLITISNAAPQRTPVWERARATAQHTGSTAADVFHGC